MLPCQHIIFLLLMQIELAGLVKKAAELLDLGTQLPLKTPVESPFGTPGVCVRLPVLFSLIQPVCCAEGGVTDSGKSHPCLF